MKVNFLEVLKNLEDDELKEPNKNGVMKPVTLKDLCANALVNNADGEADEKLRKYELGLKIAGASKPIDLISDDVVLIKKCLVKYPPLFYGQAVHLLEGRGNEKKAAK